MSGTGDANRLVAAIRFLENRGLFYKFDSEERIVEVAVYRAEDADKIAAHVGHLHDLRKLTFEWTNLTDKGLGHLTKLTKLQELWLTSPHLSGEGFSSLSRMTRLKELILYTARLDARGFEHIARLPNLGRLSVHGGNYRDDEVAPLAALVKLKELTLADNDNLSGTFATHLVKLPRLRELNPGEKTTDEGLAAIATLPHLEVLYVEGPFTDVGLHEVRRLTKLQILGITSKHVTSKGVTFVEDLPELNSLSFETPLLDDEAIPSLLRCSALESMNFRTSCMTDAGLQHLRDAMPKCGVQDYERDQRKCERPADDGNATRPKLDHCTPFMTLLAEARDFDLVNGTFHKIGDRHSHWVDAAAYSSEERVIMLAWHSAGIVGNGGFEYLFAGEFPGDPDFRITAEAFKTAGLDKSYEAFQEAFALFPDGIVPHDPDERSRLYDEANKSARQGINRKLWNDDYAQEKKLAEFIRNNAGQLAYLHDPS